MIKKLLKAALIVIIFLLPTIIGMFLLEKLNIIDFY